MKNVIRILKILFILHILAGSVANASAMDIESDNTHRFMSFNILYRLLSGTHPRWSERRDVVFEVIKMHDPDIIGLQEADDLQISDIWKSFPHYKTYAMKNRLGLSEDCAIMYKPTKYELIEGGSFWLSETPHRRSTGWDAVLMRNCTWARFKIRETGDEFIVYNTHLDHRGKVAKVKSAELILDYISTHKKQSECGDIPVVLLGDINAVEKSETLRVLRSVFRDSFRVINPDVQNVGTYHTREGEVLGGKIDYVLVDANWNVHAADIISYSLDGVYPSDHFPVFAHLSLVQ